MSKNQCPKSALLQSKPVVSKILNSHRSSPPCLPPPPPPPHLLLSQLRNPHRYQTVFYVINSETEQHEYVERTGRNDISIKWWNIRGTKKGTKPWNPLKSPAACLSSPATNLIGMKLMIINASVKSDTKKLLTKRLSAFSFGYFFFWHSYGCRGPLRFAKRFSNRFFFIFIFIKSIFVSESLGIALWRPFWYEEFSINELSCCCSLY